MKLPLLQEVSLLIEHVEKGGPLTNESARKLVALVYSIMTPDHTWWRPPPIEPMTICLCCNGETITPPMSFETKDMAKEFERLNQTTTWLPIPKPPGLKE